MDFRSVAASSQSAFIFYGGLTIARGPLLLQFFLTNFYLPFIGGLVEPYVAYRTIIKR